MDDDIADLREIGIPSGTLIKLVHLNAPDRVAHVDGPKGMRETLVELSPGEKAVITVFPPGSKSPKRVAVYLPTFVEKRTFESEFSSRASRPITAISSSMIGKAFADAEYSHGRDVRARLSYCFID